MATELENLIPETDVEVEGMRGPKGDKGDSYVLTEADKEEIAQKVDRIIDSETDKTLSISGKPADAKAAGDAIDDLKADLSEMRTATVEDVGKALKVKTVDDGKVTKWEFGETGSSGAIDASNIYGHTFLVHDNLLESIAFTPKKTINNSTGAYEDLNIDWASACEEYIPVQPNQIYKFAKVVSGVVSAQSIYRGAYYAEDKTFIYGLVGGNEFTIPATAKYMRIAIDNRNATEFMFNLKNIISEHINQNKQYFYNVTMVDETLTETGKAADAKKTGDDLSELFEFKEKFIVHDNLLEGVERLTRTSINHQTGETIDGGADAICTFDYVPVEAGKTYNGAYYNNETLTKYAFGRFAYYDANKTFISGGVSTTKLTAPAGCAYIRATYDLRNTSTQENLFFNTSEIVQQHIDTNAMIHMKVEPKENITMVKANVVSENVSIPRAVKDSLITDERLLTSILTTSNANLIDRTQLIEKRHIENDGTIITTNGSTGIVYCYKIVPGTIYSATCDGYMFTQGWWLDENGKMLSKSAFASGNNTDTSPSGAYGIVLEVNYTNESYLSKSLMLVEGDTLPSAFVEYNPQFVIKREYLPGAKGNKDWSTYYWVAMGDSRTAGYSHNLIDETTGEKIWDEGEHEGNYVEIIADKTGINVDNRSWAGAAFYHREGVDAEGVGGYKQAENLPSYTDIVTVFLGTNDNFHGLHDPDVSAYGERDNAEDPYDTTTYMGGIRQLIKNVKLQCPLARIMFISDNKLGVSGVPAADGGKNKIDCLKEICSEYKIPILNLEECAQTGTAGDDYLDRKWRPYTDGLHESVVGHKFTAYAVAGEMAKYLW